MRTFRDIAIRKFRKFGLKCLFNPPKIMFLGSFDPQTLFFIIETHKRGYLTQKHAFWAINGRDRSSGVTCRREQEYKKRIVRTQKAMENSLPTQTPLPSSHISQILHVGSYPGYLSWFWVSLKSVEKCGSSRGRNFGLPIDLAHRLYNCLWEREREQLNEDENKNETKNKFREQERNQQPWEREEWKNNNHWHKVIL